MTEQLDDVVYGRLSELSELANDLLNANDAISAIELLLGALNLLPNPKNNWEAYTWINGSLGEAYFILKDYSRAKEVLFDALNGPDGWENPFILLRLGESLYEMGEKDAASQYLARAYMLEGEELFKDEDSKYLVLLKSKLLIDGP